MKSKKILFITSSLKVGGGVESASSKLFNELDKYGYKIDILTFYKHKNEYNIRNNKKKISFNLNYKRNFFLKIIYLLIILPIKLHKLIKKEKYDILIVNESDATLVGVIQKIFNKKLNIISIIHSNILHKDNIYRHIVFIYKYIDHIICVSKGLEEIIRKNKKINKVPIQTIYNIINIEEIKRKSKEKVKEKYIFKKGIFNYINIGRLTGQKNHKLLLDAYEKIYIKYKNTQLILIYGSNEGLYNIKKYIKNLKSKNNILLLGIKENPYKYIKNADALVLSSNREGFGLVLIESLICNTYTISTDCLVGPREILTDDLKYNKKINYPYFGKYGILTKNGDIDNLYIGMKYIYNYKGELYKNNTKKIKEFDKKNIVASRVKLINDFYKNKT